MLRINYAESSFVVRGMSEAASCAEREKQNKTIKTSAKLMKTQVLHQLSDLCDILSPSLWGRLTCIAVGAEAIEEAEQRNPVSPPSLPSLGTWT